MGNHRSKKQTHEMKLIITLATLIACASAFQAPASLASKATAKPCLSMAAPSEPKAAKWATALAAIPMCTTLPALAEGTGEIFGVTDDQLGVALFIPFLLILSQFIAYDQSRAEEYGDTDFFDSYDSRRTGDRGNNP